MTIRLVCIKLIAISLPLFTVACSTNIFDDYPIDNRSGDNQAILQTDDITNQNNTTEETEKALNCRYTMKKGIAEIIRVSKMTIYFTFTPGDIEFQLNSHLLLEKDILPHKYREFKAIYKSPGVNNTSGCPAPRPELVIN